MAALRVVFVVALMGLVGPALTQDAESGASASLVREPRGHRKRLCKKYGICGQQGYGGQQSHQQGYQQGYQPGYQQGYPPTINIGISQSQSSASAGGGGYSNGYYPNNYQYNGHKPGYGGYQGGFGGHGGSGFGGPGFSNGQGGYNNQFNGNYYGPGAGNGFGFPGQGGYYDEAQDEESHDDAGLSPQEQHDQALFGDEHRPQGHHGQGHDYALSGSFAFAGRKNN